MGRGAYSSWGLKELAFFSPVDHVLSDLSAMICLSWEALHSMVHSFIDLDKAVVHVISLDHMVVCDQTQTLGWFSVIVVFILCTL